MRMGYKVVRVQGTLLVSAVQGPCGGGIEYTPNKWVRPKKNCGPLCLFRSLAQARDLQLQMVYGCAIHRCQYKRSKGNAVYDQRCLARNRDVILAKKYLPLGTILARAIKLGKQVYP